MLPATTTSHFQPPTATTSTTLTAISSHQTPSLAQNSPKPFLTQATKRWNLNSSWFIFEIFAIVQVVIYIYMIKIIINMQFLLSLELFEIVGFELEHD